MRELIQRDVDDFFKAISDQPVSNEILRVIDCLKLGHDHYDGGRFDQARRAYSRGLANSRQMPRDESMQTTVVVEAELLASLADSHANLGDFEDALTATDQAISIFSSTNFGSNITLLYRLLSIRDRRAFYLSWMGRCDTAAIESEDVIAQLRALLLIDVSFENNLARSLDHRAEILERAHRLDDALIAAEESTRIREALAQRDSAYRVSHLRSAVTLARLTGASDNAAKAVAICERALQTLSAIGDAAPTELSAQIMTCHGRYLMSRGHSTNNIDDLNKGAVALEQGAKLFRSMVEKDPRASVFRDAYAEVLTDMGVSLLDSASDQARCWLIKAAAQKRYLVREDLHPLHQSGFATALVRLGQADLACGRTRSARRNFIVALDVFERIGSPVFSFPETAVWLSQGLISTEKNEIDAISHFQRIEKLFSQTTDMADDGYLDEVQGDVDIFHGLWLRHFLANNDGVSLVSVLARAHGHRLGRLARIESQFRARSGMIHADERSLLDLRCKIHKLDLEMAEIISARNPSTIHNEYTTEPSAVIVGTSTAVKKAGATLIHARDELFRQYIKLTDRLTDSGCLPNIADDTLSVAFLLRNLKAGSALAVWCVPQSFGIPGESFVVLFTTTRDKPVIMPVAALERASVTFAQLMGTLRVGRSGMRDGGVRAPIAVTGMGIEIIDALLASQMHSIWEMLLPHLLTHGITQIDMVTHSDAHNLPWLATCPPTLQLRQFPSLHFYARRNQAQLIGTPSTERPLVLITDTSDDRDLLRTLYYLPFEVATIRLLWGAAVLDEAQAHSVTGSKLSAVWIAGHGFTYHGHPIMGKISNGKMLEHSSLFLQPNLQIGLIYTSTCYLGRTKDVDGEPVGLPSLAGLRPETPYATGSAAPVDDLGAALLALLFHVSWKETSDSRAAFDLARKALGTGIWSERAKETFREVCHLALPPTLARLKHDATIHFTDVATRYPECNQDQIEERQFLIQRQASEGLAIWQTSSLQADHDLSLDDMIDAALSHLTAPESTQGRFRQTLAAANYWAWFG